MAASIFLFIVVTIMLFIFLIVTLQQLLVSPVHNQMLSFRIGIVIAVLFEIADGIVLIFSTSTDTKDGYGFVDYILFWFLMTAMTYVIHRTIERSNIVTSNDKNIQSKWTQLEKICVIVTVAHILWLLTCFVLFIITTNTRWTNIYYIGFYLYLLFSCVVTVIVSFHVRAVISSSFHIIRKQLRGQSYQNGKNGHSNHLDVHSPTVLPSDSPGHNRNNAFPTIKYIHNTHKKLDAMETLAMLSKAKTINHIRICTAIIIAFISVIQSLGCALYVVHSRKQPLHKGNFVELREFLFHYSFVFIFYVPPIILQWIPLKSASNQSIYHFLTGKVHKILPKLFDGGSNNPKEKLQINNGLQRQNGSSKAADIKIKSGTSLQFDANDLDLHTSSKNSNSVAATSIRKTDLVNNASFSNKKQIRLSANHVELSLQRIDSKGRQIGRRGAVKPKKHKDSDSSDHQIFICPQNIEDYKSNTNTQVINTSAAISRPITSVDPTAQVNANEIEDILDTIAMSDDDHEISVVVLEFANVLCTNIEKLEGKTQKFANGLSKVQKELCFGGYDRLNEIKIFLKGLRDDDANIKFFVITDEKYKLVMQLMNDCGILKYFISKSYPNKNEFVSHIIGCDKNMYVECNGMKHLIIMKLMSTMHKAHNELLFVSSDEAVIKHLEEIKLCETYFVKTKGLTQGGMDDISSYYFEDNNFVYIQEDDSLEM